MAGRMRDAKVSGRAPDRVIVVNTGGMAPGGITYNMLNYLTKIAVDGRVAVTVVATIFYDEYMIAMFRKAGCVRQRGWRAANGRASGCTDGGSSKC